MPRGCSVQGCAANKVVLCCALCVDTCGTHPRVGVADLSYPVTKPIRPIYIFYVSMGWEEGGWDRSDGGAARGAAVGAASARDGAAPYRRPDRAPVVTTEEERER